MTSRKHTYTYKVAGECEVRADVYTAGRQAPAPVVVWIHGGALIAGHRGDLAPMTHKRTSPW